MSPISWARVWLDLFPEPGHVDVHGTAVAVVGPDPHALQDEIARQGRPSVPGQKSNRSNSFGLTATGRPSGRISRRISSMTRLPEVSGAGRCVSEGVPVSATTSCRISSTRRGKALTRAMSFRMLKGLVR